MSTSNIITKTQIKEATSSYRGFTLPEASYTENNSVVSWCDSNGLLIEDVYTSIEEIETFPVIESVPIDKKRFTTTIPHHGKKVASYRYLPPHLTAILFGNNYFAKNFSPLPNDMDFRYIIGNNKKMSRIFYLLNFLLSTTESSQGPTIQETFFNINMPLFEYSPFLANFTASYESGTLHATSLFIHPPAPTSAISRSSVTENKFYKANLVTTYLELNPVNDIILIYVENGSIDVTFGPMVSGKKVIIISEGMVTFPADVGTNGLLVISRGGVSPTGIPSSGCNYIDFSTSLFLQNGQMGSFVTGITSVPIYYPPVVDSHKALETAGEILKVKNNEVYIFDSSLYTIEDTPSPMCSATTLLMVRSYSVNEYTSQVENASLGGSFQQFQTNVMAYHFMYQYGVKLEETFFLRPDAFSSIILYSLGNDTFMKKAHLAIQTTEIVTNPESMIPEYALPIPGIITETLYENHHHEGEMVQTYRVDLPEVVVNDIKTAIVFSKPGKYLTLNEDGYIGFSPYNLQFSRDDSLLPVAAKIGSHIVRPSDIKTLVETMPTQTTLTLQEGSDPFSAQLVSDGNFISKYRKLVEISPVTRSGAIFVGGSIKNLYDYCPLNGAVLEIVETHPVLTKGDNAHPLLRQKDVSNGVVTIRNADPYKTTGQLVTVRVKHSMHLSETKLYPKINVMDDGSFLKSNVSTLENSSYVTYADHNMVHIRVYQITSCPRLHSSKLYVIKKDETISTPIGDLIYTTQTILSTTSGLVTKIDSINTDIHSFVLTDNGESTHDLLYIFPSLVAVRNSIEFGEDDDQFFGGAMMVFSESSFMHGYPTDIMVTRRAKESETPHPRLYIYDQKLPKGTLPEQLWMNFATDIGVVDQFVENSDSNIMQRSTFDQTETISYNPFTETTIYILKKTETVAVDALTTMVPFPGAISYGTMTVFHIDEFNKNGTRKEIILNFDAQGKINRDLLPVIKPDSQNPLESDYYKGSVIVSKTLPNQERLRAMTIEEIEILLNKRGDDGLKARVYSYFQTRGVVIHPSVDDATGQVYVKRIILFESLIPEGSVPIIYALINGKNVVIPILYEPDN